MVLKRDKNDPLGTYGYYNSPIVKYLYATDVYLIFTSLYKSAIGILDIRPAVSRDGIKWTWPEKKPFISRGKPVEFDGRHMYIS